MTRVLAAFVLALFLVGPLLAAPKKAAAPVALDVVTGELRVSLDSPIVVLRQPDGSFEDHWLVFAGRPDLEQFCRGLVPGTMVKVRGTVGRGGKYSYVVVSEISVVE